MNGLYWKDEGLDSCTHIPQSLLLQLNAMRYKEMRGLAWGKKAENGSTVFFFHWGGQLSLQSMLVSAEQ